MKILDAALEWAHSGVAVFALRPGEKIPHAGTSGCRDATMDEDTIRSWWVARPASNLGIATGRVDGATLSIVVVDVDSEAHPIIARMAPTRTHRTPRGWHYVYRLPDGEKVRNSASKLAPGVDVRGEGGYVVAPPSALRLGDGSRASYEVAHDLPIADLPPWILEELREAAPVARDLDLRVRSGEVVDRYVMRAIEEEARAVLDAPEGARNATLNRAAYSLGQLVGAGHASASEVSSLLLDAGLAAGLTERECRLTIRSGLEAGARNPRSPGDRGPGVGGGRRALLEMQRADDGAEYVVGGCERVRTAAELVREESERAIGEARERRTREGRDRAEADARARAVLLRLRDLGGLCDAYPAWLLRSCDYPQPAFAALSTVALGAAVTQRRLMARGLAPSVLAVLVGPSGCGKNRPLHGPSAVLEAAGWASMIGPSSLASSASLIDMIRDRSLSMGGLYLVLDEYGMQLSSWTRSRAGSALAEIKRVITEIATIDGRTWRPGKSRAQGGGHETIDAPAITLLGASTSESLREALSGVDVADGSAGRHLWARALHDLPPAQHGSAVVPPEIVDAVQAIRGLRDQWVADAQAAGDLACRPLELDLSPAASSRLAAYRAACDDARRTGERVDLPPATLARLAEQALRVSIGLAQIARPIDPEPTIGDGVVDVAIEIVEESARTFASFLREHATSTPWDHGSQIEQVIAAIRRATREGRPATRSEILRSCRQIRADQLSQIVDRLLAEGEIMASGRGLMLSV